MNKTDRKFLEIRAFCEANANPEIVKKYSRFFTEGYDAYGLGRVVFETQRDHWLREWKGDFTIRDYLELGNKLIATGKYEEAGFAISFMYHNAESFTPEIFEGLGAWLEDGIVNWGNTDVLSGKGLAWFFTSGMLEIEVFGNWVGSSSIWKRRAIPVTLVELVKTDLPLQRILAVIEPLMMDSAKKVQQGLGWLLRESWKRDPALTEPFLLKWKDSCGRTIIQYATEKMSREERLKYRKK